MLVLLLRWVEDGLSRSRLVRAFAHPVRIARPAVGAARGQHEESFARR